MCCVFRIALVYDQRFSLLTRFLLDFEIKFDKEVEERCTTGGIFSFLLCPLIAVLRAILAFIGL